MKNLKQFCYGFGVGVTLTALTLYSPLNGDVMKEPQYTMPVKITPRSNEDLLKEWEGEIPSILDELEEIIHDF